MIDCMCAMWSISMMKDMALQKGVCGEQQTLSCIRNCKQVFMLN